MEILRLLVSFCIGGSIFCLIVLLPVYFDFWGFGECLCLFLFEVYLYFLRTRKKEHKVGWLGRRGGSGRNWERRKIWSKYSIWKSNPIKVFKCSSSLALRKLQIKATLRFHLTQSEWLKPKESSREQTLQGCGGWGALFTAGGNAKCCGPLQISMEILQNTFLKKSTTWSSYTTPWPVPKGLNNLLLGIP